MYHRDQESGVRLLEKANLFLTNDGTGSSLVMRWRGRANGKMGQFLGKGSQTIRMGMKYRFPFLLILDMYIAHMWYGYKDSEVKKKKTGSKTRSMSKN